MLGSGGFSDVYLYEQHLPRRRVAVKVLLGGDDLNETSRQAFIGEANVMAQMSSHPYIVTIFHADVASDGRPYFVMEYAPGRSLSERYKTEWIPVEEVLRTGVRISSAVATAHSVGVLHRDIKPANILTNDFGWPALTDFGISSAVDDELADAAEGAESTAPTSSGMGMSVPWSPPEMFDDDPQPSVRSEVFSLGATLYTLVAGHTPFEVRGRKNGTIDLIGRIERGEITPIQRPDVPPALVEVLHRAMALRPSARYATAIEFARALQRIELELGYQPTAIDVPSLHVDAPTRPTTGGDDDETSVRQMSVIQAQPTVTVLHEGGRAGTDELTSTRNVIRVAAQQTSPIATVRSPSPVAPDSTGERAFTPPSAVAAPAGPSVPAATPARVAPPAAPPGTPPGAVTDSPGASTETRPARRNLVVLIVVGIVVTLLTVTAIVGSGLLPRESAQGPTSTSEFIGGGGPPTPTAPTSTLSETGEITFTWQNPDPRAGDVYFWWPTDGSGKATSTSETSAVVGPYTPGTTVCISIEIRRDGKGSPEPLVNCFSG
nr:serine/threonine-protein kinase [Pseudoclavibacter chungangensis]